MVQEKRTQARERCLRRGRVEAGEDVARHGHAAYDIARGVDIAPVEDRLMNVGEAHLIEAGGGQDRLNQAGSAGEKGFFRVGAEMVRPGFSAESMAVAHSLRSWLCQTSITNLAPGGAARAMFANAGTGSSKNIVPKRLMITSNCRCPNRCTCNRPARM
jgi:hypothetical protein